MEKSNDNSSASIRLDSSYLTEKYRKEWEERRRLSREQEIEEQKRIISELETEKDRQITEFIKIKTAKTANTKEFVSLESERLYALYKTEKENAIDINEQTLVMSKLQNSDRNLIIQGPAGSSKSTLLKKYIDGLPKVERSKILLTAPTGKAADIIGGVTIHKAFEFPNSVQMLDEEITEIPKMLRNISTVVIDELSMVRVDVFTKIMQVLQFAKYTVNRTM